MILIYDYKTIIVSSIYSVFWFRSQKWKNDPVTVDCVQGHKLNLFEDIEHAQLLATQWQWTYNNIRPHSAIGGVPPRQLL